MRSARLPLLPVLALAFSFLLVAGDAAPALVGPHEFQQRLEAAGEQAVLLDVRTPAEYEAGHLAGALLLNFKDPSFVQRLEKLPKDRPYFVYCRSGNRSHKAVAAMQAAGFRHIVELKGGILAWNAEHMPLCRPALALP